ncbi:hypothetical protein PQX77_022343 [Marasmius sp. AFHP31]|nr:hypothetical protein PQX77_022343 [Marasmius sp. AFHP31]
MILESCLIEQHVMKKEFTGSMGKFSFTTDGWTTCTLFPFIAVIAHWMQAVPIKDTKLQEQLIIESNLVLRSDLIGFYGLPISHTGQHLAAVRKATAVAPQVTQLSLFCCVHYGLTKWLS